jgi:hypothetical protein
MQVTVCGKITDTSLYPVVDATSHLMDKVERLYFKERYIKHADRNGLKRLFLKEYGITGRQLNGIIFNLSGNVEANRQALLRNLETKKRKLDKVGKRIKSALKSDRKDWFKIHQYKRQVAYLKHEGITCDILRVETRDDFIEAISKHHFDIFFCRLPITMLRRSFCACHRKGKVPEHNVHIHLMVIWNRRPSK